jgi:ribosomal protein L12E/L44/L45/RPP1/RPP2
MKFWYSLIAAILLSTLSWFGLEELQNAFVPHQNTTALQSLENTKDHHGIPSKDTQEGKDEEDNKEEKDSEEEKRENESKHVAFALTNNYIYWYFIHNLLPSLTITKEQTSKETITLEIPLYVLYACLKINC